MATPGSTVRETASLLVFSRGQYCEFTRILGGSDKCFKIDFWKVILATAPLCTTQGTYLANRILLGFLGAPVESLCEISITDIVR